jgi:hypothetical protein
MKAIVWILTLWTVSAHASTACRQAMDTAVKKHAPVIRYESIRQTPIGNEHLVEVIALVYGWSPRSASMSGYYYLVSATCKETGGGRLVLADELADFGEGGVKVKVITKDRYGISSPDVNQSNGQR